MKECCAVTLMDVDPRFDGDEITCRCGISWKWDESELEWVEDERDKW